MAINQNHLFEELNGVKCAVVEKNVAVGRVEFLRQLLEYNGYVVVVVASPPAKGGGGGAVPAGGGAGATVEGVEAAPPAPETFTVGVTDVMFNAVNAIFGRLLRTPEGHVVTLAYWQQKESEARDDMPYFAGG